MKLKYIKQSTKKPKTVAVIGGGWNGAHIAKKLAERGYKVTLYESNRTIFSGISGKFGIRIHAGPHYPRSWGTREGCHSGFYEFCSTYPLLVNEHKCSIYAIAARDANNEPSKVNKEQFEEVCQEFQYIDEIDIEVLGCNTSEVLSAFDIHEPSAVLGPRLRRFFEETLQEHRVTIRYNFFVTKIKKNGDSVTVGNEKERTDFDFVVNTTSYKSLLPNTRPLPFKMKLTYQICLALVYKDLSPSEKPISLIFMDGWFPCLMPYDDRSEITNKPLDKYILTHGKWTIVGSYDSAEEANQYFSVIDDDFVEQNIKTPSEAHMTKLWPIFSTKYQYMTWTGAVLAKIQTNTEFRGAITFQDPTMNMIYVLPGKISNIFAAERETLALMHGRDVMTTNAGYRYIKNSMLYNASCEISEPIKCHSRTTCKLQTFRVPLEKKWKDRLRLRRITKPLTIFKKHPVRRRSMSDGDVPTLHKSTSPKREKNRQAHRSLTL